MPEKITRSFSTYLRQTAAADSWDAQYEHPFIKGISDGTLSMPRFRYWVRQDGVFLIEYARLLSLAASRGHDLDTMTRFAALAHHTLKTEMALRRAYAKSIGISAAALAREKQGPTAWAYMDFLVRTANLGGYGDLLAAILPYMWGSSDIALHLKKKGLPKSPGFRKWIQSYASPEFAQQAAWCRKVVDAVAKESPPADLRRMEQAFIASVRYQLALWDMAWKQEKWEEQS